MTPLTIPPAPSAPPPPAPPSSGEPPWDEHKDAKAVTWSACVTNTEDLEAEDCWVLLTAQPQYGPGCIINLIERTPGLVVLHLMPMPSRI